MPELVLEGEKVVSPGLGGRRARPAGVPEDWVLDRKTGEWRPPRKRGPKPKDAQPEEAQESVVVVDDADPEPARLKDQQAREPAARWTREAADDVRALFGLVGMFALPPIAARDPFCGGALTDSWPKITEACLPLIARSPRLVRWLTSAGGARDWVMLAAALQPVAAAVVQHHLLRVRPDSGEQSQAFPIPEEASAA